MPRVGTFSENKVIPFIFMGLYYSYSTTYMMVINFGVSPNIKLGFISDARGLNGYLAFVYGDVRDI